jgi:hypothetical protein
MKKKIKPKKQQPKREIRTNEEQDLFHWEKLMSDDFNKLIDNWALKGVPIEQATIFSAYYITNFIFSTLESMDANHILSKALSRELLRSKEISRSDITLQ